MFGKPTPMFSISIPGGCLRLLTYAYVQTYSVNNMMNFKKGNNCKCQQTKYFKKRNKETRSEVENLIVHSMYIPFTIDGLQHWLTFFFALDFSVVNIEV